MSCAKAPISNRKIQAFDANATAGHIAERSRNGAYAFACWIAWPTSCAAIAVDATACPPYTGSERCTDFLRGS